MSRAEEEHTAPIGHVCPRCRTTPPGADGICPTHGLYAIPPGELASLRAAPLLGHIIDDRYALTGHIGAGGMGAVYRAWQLRIGRAVALKLLHLGMGASEAARARFEQEARAIATLQSDYTVRVFDFGEVEQGPLTGTLYMVMDLVEGFSLTERLRAGPLLIEEVGLVLRHVADSVDEAHGKGIVHRDLKPSNILLTEHQGQRRAKVIDFGIARIDGGGHTVAGSVLGTPGYMAPELWSKRADRPIDGRVDVYAMGVVLYQLLTGRRPFPEREIIALATAHCHTPPPRLALPGDPIAAFEPVVARAMAKDPAQRHRTLGELAAAFEGRRAAIGRRVPSTGSFTWTHPVSPTMADDRSRSSVIPRGEISSPAPVEAPPRPASSRWWPLVALLAIGVALGLAVLRVDADPEPTRGAAGRAVEFEQVLSPMDEPATPPKAPTEGPTTAPAIPGAPSERPALEGVEEGPLPGRNMPTERGAHRALPPVEEEDTPRDPPAVEEPAPPPRAEKTVRRAPRRTAKRPSLQPKPSPGEALVAQIEKELGECQCTAARARLRKLRAPGMAIDDQRVRALARRVDRCKIPVGKQPCIP